MSTADLAIVSGTVVELATIGAVGALVYTRRILLAASPKPQAPQQLKVPADGADTGPIQLRGAS